MANMLPAGLAAGCRDDHPQLLPNQAWYHYRNLHTPDGGARLCCHLTLDQLAVPDPAELHYRLGRHLESAADEWEAELERGERVIVSLEWRVPGTPTAGERGEWLIAWLRFGIDTLARFRRPGVLIVHTLLVETAEPAEARAWCDEARELYRANRPKGEAVSRFRYHHLAPLSLVPVEDIEDFLGEHYHLPKHHPELDPYQVAHWVHDRTDGLFAPTVEVVERLHDTAFREAYEALAGNRTG